MEEESQLRVTERKISGGFPARYQKIGTVKAVLDGITEPWDPHRNERYLETRLRAMGSRECEDEPYKKECYKRYVS